MVKSSGPLTVRLTEPITFLRGSATGQDFRGRPQILPSDASPAMVRGLLTLKLTKSSRIKRIEIALRGISRTEWPEGIGPRRLETSEEHVIISEAVTFFTASESHSRSRDRRAVSVGPGSYFEEEDDAPDADDDEAGPSGLGDGWAGMLGRGREPQRGGGGGRSFSVGGDRLEEAMSTMPSSRRQSFDRETRPDLSPLQNGSRNGGGRSGEPSAHSLREAILTHERGPSPAYTPQDPLHARQVRAHSLLRHERPDMPLDGLSPIASAVQSETSRDPSREPRQSVPTRPPVGPPNAGIAPPILDEAIESDSSARTRRDTAFSTSSRSTASSLQTTSHPASPAVEDRSSFMLDTQDGRAVNGDRDRRDSAATQTQENLGRSSPRPTQQDEYVSVSRRGSRQTSLIELIPSPAHSPSLRPADGLIRGPNLQDSPSSSRRSSGLGRRPSISQLHNGQPGSDLGSENAGPSSSASRDDRGRKSSKFSLSGVSSALRGLSHDVKGRVSQGRASSRAGGKEKEQSNANDSHSHLPTHGGEPFIPPHGRGGAGRNVSSTRRAPSPQGDERSSSRARGRNKGLKVLNGALGLDEDFDGTDEVTHSWKEFRKGTYNYPISFAIPASSPPTIHADFGSVTYRLRATVFRAGALTPNFVEDTEVLVLASPNEDDLEESENIIVERQWEDQMRYLIALSGKSFPVGGHIPISVRMMPLAKCKIYRFSVTIEEKVDYFALERKVARHEAVKKYPLLNLKGGTDKQAEPLLPIFSDSPTALTDSPLAPLAAQARQSNEDEDDAMASLLNPHGPWFLESTLQVPDCQSHIRFSTKHAQTNMSIAHWLKVVIRVERGDDKAVDSKGRRKQFDIIIETPLHLLDCRVNTQFNTLPTYSTASAAIVAASPQCSVHGSRHVGNDSRIGSAAGGAVPSGSTPRSTSVIPAVAALVAGAPSERRASEVSPARHEEGDTLLERNIVYDRLVSGQESEAGEAPPTYIEALSARHDSRSRSRAPSGSRSRSRLGAVGSTDSLAI